MGNTSKIPQKSAKSGHDPQSEFVYQFDGFVLDPRERLLSRDGEPISLTAKVFDTLLLLIENGGHLVFKDDLMKSLWPDSFVEEVNLNQNISVLRKALGENAQSARYIVTVPGRGYRFTAVVKRVAGLGTSPDLSPGEYSTPQDTEHWFPRWLIAGVLLGVIASALLFALHRSGTNTVSYPDLLKAHISRVTESGKAPNAAVSPDGRYVAYVEVDGDEYSLWAKQLSTGGKTQALPRETSILRYPTFSPDGNYIYFTRMSATEPGGLYRIPVLGGAQVAVLKDVDSAISFSPDGKQFAFMRGVPHHGEYQILIADLASGTERILASRKSPLLFLFFGPSWSPDGKTIAVPAVDYTKGRHWSIILLSVIDGSSREVYSSNNFVGHAQWLPDGSGLITVVSETLSWQFSSWQGASGLHISGGAIWHIAHPSGEARRLTNDLTDYDVCCIGVSNDGKTLIDVENSLVSNLWVASADTPDKPTQITWGDPIYRRHAWLPDNKTIVYRDLKGNLNRIHKDGTAGNVITPAQHKVVSGASVCGGGRYLVFESTVGNSIWRIDTDGANPTRLSSGYLDSGPACSAEENQVLYTSTRDGLSSIWLVSLEGHEPIPYVPEHSLEVLPSPSGRLVYYLAVEWEQRLTPLRHMNWVVINGADRRRLFSIERPVHAVFGPVWSPGETGLDYVITSGGVSNIWRQPLDGSPPVQITHFTSGRIFSIAWSPNGKWLSLASGDNRSDVVSISHSN